MKNHTKRGATKPSHERVAAALLGDAAFARGLRRLHTAVQAARRAWLNATEPPEARLLQATYLAAVTDAQSELARLIIGCEDQLGRLSSNVALLRSDREQQQHAIKTRIRLLRRLNDSFLWDLLGGQLWIFRRMSTGTARQSPLGSSNVGPALAAIADYCNAGPLRAAVLCDATTFVEVADVLGLDFSGDTPRILLVEVKEGTMNEVLLPLVESDEGADSEKLVGLVGQLHGSHAAKQMRRMLRQKTRLDGVTAVMNKNIGRDLSGHQVMMSRDVQFLPGFDDLVHACVDEMVEDQTKTFSIREVEDGAVLIGAYRGPMANGMAMRGWMQAIHADGPIVDIMDGVFASLAAPLFSNIAPWRLLRPLLLGKIRLLLGINLDRLPELAEEQGFRLQWESGKRARQVLAQHKDLLSWKGRALSAIGDHGGYSVSVGAAVVSRIAFDFTLPSAAITLVDPRRATALREQHRNSG